MQGREYRIHQSGLTRQLYHHCSAFFLLAYKYYGPAVHINNDVLNKTQFWGIS